MNLRVRNCLEIDGEVIVGGDKSITHRALIIGALAQGQTEIRGYSRCDDCQTTIRILKSLGVSIREDEDVLLVDGVGRYGFSEPGDCLNCENSGTTMRLISGLLSGQKFYSVLTGDGSLRRRPMDRIIIPLRMMGAQIMARAGDRLPPVSIKGGRLNRIRYKLPVASAQVKSAILLAGLYTDRVVVEEPFPTRDHTERLLNLFGVTVIKRNREVMLEGPEQELKPRQVIIPGDISSASFFIGLGALIPGCIRLKKIGLNPTRSGIIDILKKMGVAFKIENYRDICNEPVGDLLIEGNKGLEPFSISGPLIPRIIDELPILSVIATQAQGVSVIKDAQELRLKETDRIGAIAQGLRAMGGRIEELKDGLVIEGPTRLSGTRCRSFGDHRIAMSLTIAGLIAEGETIIEDAECIRISFPEFITELQRVCGEGVVEYQD